MARVPRSFIPDDEAPETFTPDPELAKPTSIIQVEQQSRSDYQPPTIHRPAGPEAPFWFPGRRATYRENQARTIEATTRLEIAQESHAAALEMHARATDHALRTQPIRLAEVEEATVAAHGATMAGHHLTTELTYRALERGTDIATNNLLTLEEEKVKTDIKRARRMAAIDIAKARSLESNRLRGYEREARIDMEAVLGMHMLPVEKLDYMNAKILRLKKQDAEPERIQAMEGIRDQMERRLLESSAQEELEGTDDAQESL